MKELKNIVEAYTTATTKGKQTALATVVHVEGSSYRRPGARMLIADDGQLTGAISGGCLEGDALKKALLAITENRNMLVTYDTNDEDDATIGMGLGCNGIIQVLIEPLGSRNDNNPILLLKQCIEKRERSVLVTLFSMQDRKAEQAGTSFLYKENSVVNNNSSFLQQQLQADAKIALQQQRSSFRNYITSAGAITAFIEYIQAPVSLMIAGAGNDVVPLATMGKLLGWDITIIDGRASYAKAERFPAACRVLLARPGELLKQAAIDDQTAFVLMTHNYNYDMAILQELIGKDVPYIGLLGPAKKRDRMLGELKEKGFVLPVQQLATIHAPVGLDIGAETPAEIALSIIAEIQAVFSSRNGQSLKNNAGTIHDRSATAIEEIRLTTD